MLSKIHDSKIFQLKDTELNQKITFYLNSCDDELCTVFYVATEECTASSETTGMESNRRK
jgi:hypothetical protein